MKISDVTGIFGVLISLFLAATAWISLSIAGQTFTRGPVPEKHLMFSQGVTTEALKDLRNAGGAITVLVDASGTSLKSVYITTLTLTNDGGSPILPNDIFRKIALKIRGPWKLVTVTNSQRLGDSVDLEWKKESDTEFRAEPALINPGDAIFTTAYTTLVDDKSVSESDKLTPPFEWDARISNLQSISPDTTDPLASFHNQLLPVVVFLTGNSVLAVGLLFLMYLGLYAYLLNEIGIFSSGTTACVASIPLIGLLSLTAAESGTHYLFPPPFFSGGNFENVTPIVLNFSAIILLTWRYYRQKYVITGRRGSS